MSDIFEIYSPLKAKNLTPEQIANMQHLTADDVKELARRYPNSQYRYNYLLLIDTSKKHDKAMDHLSTWPNLHALWSVNQKQFVPYNFRNNVQKVHEVKSAPKAPVHVGPKVVDLSVIEAQNAAGLKKQEAETTVEEVAPVEPVEEITADVPTDTVDEIEPVEEIETESEDIAQSESFEDNGEIPVDNNIPTGDDDEQPVDKQQTPKRKYERKK